ncbi:Ribonuclease H-like domain,Zinc finger C2H2-type,HAT, C-terminal dimerisation domain,Zinc finger, BED- [Cinara cedri]|uniref:Ribonuclease H-like domain,Zinc finger C2H2-type,HAT, C-terminal dimerisation domain,Zinc finger, BED n=1 Tax=Cinara cedri TaxID=506608 RepID=A0A5E4N1L0_9HEMI|nr:Ribonuclease H-like domain,Zinc finger C2H2-type,HAT, C-terminal dimerisation domain,Zinc finger, BED- [Cinara cedri]
MGRSIVWKYFIKNNNGTATCQLCQKTLKTSGNTSNLSGHLTCKHSSFMVSKANSTATPRQELETSDVDDPSLTLSLLSTASTSNMSFTASTSHSSNIPSTNVVPSSNIDTAFKRQKINESFSQIVSYQYGGFKSAKLINAILYMIAKDNQPLSIDISRFLEGKYKSFKDLFKNELNKLASGLLGVIYLQERHTSLYIADTLNKVCKQWDISLENITAIVTDGAANLTKAVDLLFGNPNNKRHIPCFAYTLHLVAQNAISSVTDLSLLINNVKSIITWFKHSEVASDELRKVSNSKLIQEVPTIWNCTFYMLERFIALCPFINDIVNRNISAPTMVCAKDIEEMTEIIAVLRPLEAATKELCSEQYVSSSMVIPIVHILQTKIDEATSTQILSTQLKNALKLECSKRLGQIENVSFFAISTILDPRFKKMYFKNSGPLSKMLTKISEEIKSYQITSESSSDSSQNKEYSLWNNDEKIIQQSSHSRERATRKEIGYPSELNLYLKSAVGRLTDNQLFLWNDMSTVYPILSKVALKYLSTVATSVPSERLFSKAGLIMSQQRSRLTIKKLNMQLFLQSVDESFWEL